MFDHSGIMAEGDLATVRAMAEEVTQYLPVRVLKAPAPAMVMVRHAEPLENTPFHLGEAYVTECEVEVDGRLGYGCVLGPNEERALCAAIVDAVVGSGHPIASQLRILLEQERARLEAERLQEARAVGGTRVDFEVR
jgi:alpha-D-ribose 1-methylphosphonate 5-triphosphate synthase subunit PhnG